MHGNRAFTGLVASVLMASLAAACGGASAGSSSSVLASRGPTPIPTPMTLADYPGGFPTSYVNAQATGDPGLKPVAGGLEGHSTGTLRADNGTSGTYTSTWVENRVATAAVTCGGAKYANVFVGETPEITTDLTFTDWGHATLVTTGHIVVYRSSRNGSSPAICDESKGGTFKFEFTRDPIKQLMSGTWHWDPKGLLVFDPPPAASPSPS
jgi:hypothetical protein